MVPCILLPSPSIYLWLLSSWSPLIHSVAATVAITARQLTCWTQFLSLGTFLPQLSSWVALSSPANPRCYLLRPFLTTTLKTVTTHHFLSPLHSSFCSIFSAVFLLIIRLFTNLLILCLSPIKYKPHERHGVSCRLFNCCVVHIKNSV